MKLRTVLATDEMLAKLVSKKIDAEIEWIGHDEMHEIGKAKARAKVREAVLREPCVLVIGTVKWDALPDLEAMRLPYSVPVVLVTEEITPERYAQAATLDVFSAVPATMPGISTCVANEALLAHACRLGLRSRAGLRSLLLPPQPRPQRSTLAPVLTLRASPAKQIPRSQHIAPRADQKPAT